MDKYLKVTERSSTQWYLVMKPRPCHLTSKVASYHTRSIFAPRSQKTCRKEYLEVTGEEGAGLP